MFQADFYELVFTWESPSPPKRAPIVTRPLKNAYKVLISNSLIQYWDLFSKLERPQQLQWPLNPYPLSHYLRHAVTIAKASVRQKTTPRLIFFLAHKIFWGQKHFWCGTNHSEGPTNRGSQIWSQYKIWIFPEFWSLDCASFHACNCSGFVLCCISDSQR